MVQNIDLRKLETKVWTSYFDDGLWDIFFGLMLLIMGLQNLTDLRWLTFCLLCAMLVPILGKITITLPRMGRIKFREPRVKRIFLAIALITASVLITVIIGSIFMNKEGRFGGIAAAIVFTGLFATIFGSMAYFMNMNRLALYGLAYIFVFASGGFIDRTPRAIVETALGSLITLSGILILFRFIRRNPLTSKEMVPLEKR